jgi:MOSC domain-containing protein YiiM
MNIISVNIGSVMPIQNGKPTGKSGIFKLPQAGPMAVTRLGLPGDAIVDTKNHGGLDQAIYIYGSPDYEWWSAELGQALVPGTFGENLTISGLESAAFSAGDRLQAGGVILEVTAPRIPCVTLAARMGDPEFVKRFLAAERPGLYCRVIQEGILQVGDPVALERFGGETVTILEMMRSFYQPLPSLDYLRRFLKAPTPQRGRDEMEEKYRAYFAVTAEPDPNDVAYLEDRLIEFNYNATGYRDGELLAIFLRDDANEIYGGISGFTWGGTGKVEWLWVRDDWRGKGLGRDLLARAEEEAARRGCRWMVLDTHSFQAPDFYEKQGYEITGWLEDFPVGFANMTLRKKLSAPER